jgi:hypothetical protein
MRDFLLVIEALWMFANIMICVFGPPSSVFKRGRHTKIDGDERGERVAGHAR